MENNKYFKEDFDFLKVRDFGELIGTPFYFFRQEFKNLMKVVLRYAGPFFLAGIILMSMFSESIFALSSSYSSMSNSFFPLFFSGILYFISAYMIFLLTLSYVSLYIKQGRYNFSHAEVWSLAKQKILPAFGLAILVSLIVFAGMIFFYIPGIYLAVALSFSFVALVFDDLTVGKSISRSFFIIKGRWWFTFGIFIVFGFIVGFVSYFLVLPAVFVTAYSLTSNEFSVIQLFIVMFSVTLYFIIYVFVIVLQQILTASIYFSFYTEKEGGDIEKKIAEIVPEQEYSGEPAIFDDSDGFVNTGRDDEKPDESAEKMNDEEFFNDSTKKNIIPKDQRNRFLDDDNDFDRFKRKD